MPDRDPVETINLDRYGFPPLPWSRPHDILAVGSLGPDVTFFLGTVGPDGRPHAAGVGAVWSEGDLYFTSGPRARKAQNLAANPASTLSARLAGIDIVFEGEAVRVTDRPTLEKVVAVFRTGGWPARGPGRRIHGALQRPQRGATAVAPLSLHLPQGDRRRDGRAVRRDALALRAMSGGRSTAG
jgi:hypothetical protein